MNLWIWSMLLTQIINELTTNKVKSGRLLRYSLNRKLGGPKSRSRCFGDEKTHVPLPGIRNPDRQVRTPHYHGSRKLVMLYAQCRIEHLKNCVHRNGACCLWMTQSQSSYCLTRDSLAHRDGSDMFSSLQILLLELELRPSVGRPMNPLRCIQQDINQQRAVCCNRLPHHHHHHHHHYLHSGR
jgi:hypothetical protein